MRIVNQSDLAWEERKSPKGRYRFFQRDVSLALGGKKDVGTWGGGQPFDLAQIRVPPGSANWPRHSHTTQWELYVVLSGGGTVEADGETHEVKAGDSFVQPPGTVHRISNPGEADLVYYVIADNPPADVMYYPDSDKWFIKPQRKVFAMQEVDYFQGEE